MPRRSRLDAPGILHHVIVRGIERRPLFTRRADRQDFFERCGRLFPETGTACYAWALLTNHVHLLLRTGTVPLSTVMARLLSGYAAGFNRRHTRSGHLFQNRYKSIICEEDAYFKDLVSYIHLNPLRAGLVGDLAALGDYPWAGHAPLLGTRRCPWQDAEYALSIFGSASAYLEFVEHSVDRGHRPDLMGGGLVRSHGGWAEVKNSRDLIKGDERILGDTSFVMGILTEAKHNLERRYAMKRSGIDLDVVERRVCDLYDLKPDDLSRQGREKKLAEARSLFCFWAVRELGIPQKRLAERFSLTAPAISYAVRRGQNIATERGYKLLRNG
jgi:putative transposase